MTVAAQHRRDALATFGHATVVRVIAPSDIDGLLDALAPAPAPAPEAQATRTRNRSIYAARNLLTIPAVRDLAGRRELSAIVEPVLGPSARPVRGILFDKTPARTGRSRGTRTCRSQ